MSAEDRLYNYFLNNRTESGLVLDRESDRNTTSAAATGFGMDCWAIMASRGIITREQAVLWVYHALETTEKNTPEKNFGWLYHFTNADGTPKPTSEVSTIDTAIFYLGARQAARRLGDPDLQRRVEGMIAKINTSIVMNEAGYFYHGFYGGRLIEYLWDEWNEGVLLYKLFDKPFSPKKMHYDLPLFVFYYPLCFYDDQELASHLHTAIAFQKAKYGYWGLTATDGPHGYEAGNPKLISPLGIWSVVQYVSEAEATLQTIPVPRWTCGYEIERGWSSTDAIGIDYGCCLILLNKPGPYVPNMSNYK